MAKQFTLGKKERLKSRKLIEQLFKRGKTFTVFPFRVYFMPETNAQPPAQLQFGIGAGTKNFKKSPDRNRIKRVTREAWRLQKNNLQALLTEKNKSLAVFLIYTAKELPDFNATFKKVQIILDNLVKLIDENNTPVS